MAFDAERFCNDYNIQYWTEGKNVNYGCVAIKCPNPACGDHSNHGNFSTNYGSYKCWRCGKSKLTDVLYWLIGEEYKEVFKEYLTETVHTEFTKKKKGGASKIIVPDTGLNRIHKAYLTGRGFDPDYISYKYKVTGVNSNAYYPDIGDYRNRIIIPIIYNNRIVSYLGRSILPRKLIDAKGILRYRACNPNLEIVHHRYIMYNCDNAKKRRAILVEGSFDVMRIGDDCIGSLGTSLTIEQCLFIASRYDEIFILNDPEETAQKKARELCYTLNSLGVYTEIITLDTMIEDPATLSEKEVVYIKKELHLF